MDLSQEQPPVPPAAPKETDPLTELTTLTKVAELIEPLSEGARSRTIRWLIDRYFKTAVALPRLTATASNIRPPQLETSESKTSAAVYSTLAEMVGALQPSSDVDRTLLAAWWAQVRESRDELDAFTINRDLTNLGYRVGNITNAFTSLISRKPAYVVQLKKSGSSKQARKVYKLTTAGIQAVNDMMGGKSNGSE